MSVKTSVEAGIAEVTLDHPPVHALDSAGWRRLAETVAARGADEAVRLMIIAASGRGFCAGVDIKELARDGRLITQVNKGCYDAFAAIHDCQVPVIAAAHGFVLGGGISKKAAKFEDYLDCRTPVVAARLLNQAGIVGAALHAANVDKAKSKSKDKKK